MREDRKLLVGLDLCDDVTQLSCFDSDSGEPVSVGRLFGTDREYECPTVLAWNHKKREWFFGTEALEAAEQKSVILLDHMLSEMRTDGMIRRQGMEFTGEELLTRFLVKMLSTLNEYYPNDTILRLVVSVPDKEEPLVAALKKAMGRIGIGEDRLTIHSHKQSYMYYVLSQKKELWMNNVGLFEYGTDGMFYSQINIDRRGVPYIIGVSRKNLTERMNWGMHETEEARNLEYAFLNLANTQLHKQMVTTLYFTGKAFESEWADGALRQLCAGRRVFFGKNLFTKGACYAARELAGQGNMEDCLFLDEEMVFSNISMKAYRDAQVQELLLVRAGTPWKEIDVSLDIIPDSEEEIQISTQNVLKRVTKAHLLSMEGFKGRPNKMTRFTIRIRFADVKTCIITLKDNGFGEFCPSSNRIWERHINLS